MNAILNIGKKTIPIFILFFILHNTTISQIYSPFDGENGEFWSRNSTKVIRWNPDNFEGVVNILLWNRDSSAFSVIDTNIISDSGFFEWEIPSNHPIGDGFRVKIFEPSSSTYTISESFFPIHEEIIVPQNNSKEDEAYIEYSEAFKIFPNPTNGNFNLQIIKPDAIHLDIYNIHGLKVKTVNLLKERNFKLSISNFPNGIYIAIVKFADGNHHSGRIVVSK